LAVGCWLLAVGCWLLAVGCWLLAVGCWIRKAPLRSQTKVRIPPSFFPKIYFSGDYLPQTASPHATQKVRQADIL